VAAWETYWTPLFCRHSAANAIEIARSIYANRPDEDLVAGITAFHTRESRKDVLECHSGEIVFISGAEDIAPGPASTRQQTALARHGTCHIVPNCGHYVPLEAPDQFNAILKLAVEPYLD